MKDEWKNVQCEICDGNDWQSVDQYRHKPDGMAMCNRCGFVTYPDSILKAAELKEYYRKEYRPGPIVNNVFTGQRKIHYHSAFLSPLLREWLKEKKNPKVFEVGAAFGMFLKWIRDAFPEAGLAGSELTLAFRRVAYHEYGLQLGEEFDASKQWDLIASYKVAEHVPHIGKELRRQVESLAPGGYMYISVPTWFHTMSNFGLDGFTLEYYYDKAHINVWTKKHFETLLRKCGLEIVKKDYVVYDSTYLCKRNDELMKAAPEYEDPAQILVHLDNIFKASRAYDESNFQLAREIFPCFPDAIVADYEKNRAQWNERGFDGILEGFVKPALQACPDHFRITFLAADICLRYEQFGPAMQYLDHALKQKPNDPSVIISVAHAHREMARRMKDPKEKLQHLVLARDAMRKLQSDSFQHTHDAVTWSFTDNANLPMPGESL